MAQLEIDFETADRRSVLGLWRVDEIFNDATGDLLSQMNEDDRIERKPAGIHAESLATYVCMWANTPPVGGLIAVGVEDKTGEITGCSSKTDQLVDIERRIRCDLVRDARFDLRRIQVRTTKTQQTDFVILIWVHFREDKVVETNKGEAYIRWANSRHQLTDVEKRELMIDRGQVAFELEPCRLVWPDDFDTAAVNEWVAEVCKAKTIEKNQPAYHYLARHRLGKVDGSNFTPNNACALLFAKDPQQIIPGCMVKFQRVDGVVLKTGKDRNVVKTRDITGTVPQVITGTWEFLETQLRTYSQRSTDGKFFPVPEYPSEAWHEVIVNACVHRSYSLSGANIFVRMYDDRLEVDSPGGFPACVTPKNIYEIHYRRNWWLMEAITYLRYVLCENEGTKRIRQAMIDMGLPEPEFTQKQIEGALVRVTLKNNRDLRHKWVDTDVTDIVGEEMVGKLNDYQKRLVNFAAEHGKINISQAMNLMPKPRWHTAKRHLDKLCEMKILIHVSERLRDPSAYYTLTSKVHGETV